MCETRSNLRCALIMKYEILNMEQWANLVSFDVFILMFRLKCQHISQFIPHYLSHISILATFEIAFNLKEATA